MNTHPKESRFLYLRVVFSISGLKSDELQVQRTTQVHGGDNVPIVRGDGEPQWRLDLTGPSGHVGSDSMFWFRFRFFFFF